ncbi:acyl-CoA dehydrogenase [Corynebacterium mustelae]|uniref:Acyl-CoA dehydrogenase n=1 Tax=Corynebacterium mustelae TaxID=571915 RepID=A0A0G3H7V4_9CORY|nr:hypothetical protein [Corynebacterium mustelae]AKK07202.1 acyl-CoA dehydrogenase [Corynebacterium mustelae]
MLFQKDVDTLVHLVADEWERTKLVLGKQSSVKPEIFSVFSKLSEWHLDGPQSLSEVYETCVSLGRFDASLAWVVGVSNSAWSMLGNFPAQTIEQFGHPIVSMVLGRPGVVTFDDKKNTATINGEWKYCSGYEQSGGFVGLVKDDRPGGDVYVALMPSTELAVVNFWKAIGLKGTGSHTVKAESLVLDKDTLIPYSAILEGSICDNHATSYRNLFTGVLMNCLTGSIVGATLHLLDIAIDRVSKNPIGGSSYVCGKDSGTIRSTIGGLVSKVQEIYEFGKGGAKFVDGVANGNRELWSSKNRALLRVRASRVMNQCREVADELVWIMGSSVMVEGDPAAEIWKDIHVGALHGGFSKFIPEEAAGIALFGDDPFNLTKML